MARKVTIPIILSQQVVLPGWSYLLELSTPAEKAVFYELIDQSANYAETPKYVGVVPVKSSRKAPKAGDIGTYSRVVSCTRKLSQQDVLIRVGGEERIMIEEIVSTETYCLAHVKVLKDPEESIEDITNALDKQDLSFASAQIQLLVHQYGLKRVEFILANIINQYNFSTTGKIEILESLKFSERLVKVLLTIIERNESKLGGDNLKNFGGVNFGNAGGRNFSGLDTLFNNSLYKPFAINLKMDQRIPTLTSHISRLPISSRMFPMNGLNEPGGNKLATKIQEAKMPAEVRKLASEELSRLTSLPSHGSEHALLRNYLETLVALPWSASSQDHVDVNKAKEELERDHYAMDKVKRRVLEYLAVKQLKKSQLKGPILCFVGPPGVGKTSIARSIASILGRKFHRIGLGGVCDASDIRGSRRTYIGSMPGRIIKALQFCGTNNPVILLDEIDKMSSGSLHGNPLAVLLEVLDPEQNSQFTDHYLGVPFNLSQAVFIATANSMGTIPAPLRDRIEVIRVNGYTEEEKFHIARDFIIPKSLVEHGLDGEQVVLPDDTLRFVVASYSREAGVRSLERKINALMRDAALKIAADLANNQPPLPLLIDEETAKAVLGRSYYYKGSDLHWTEGTVPGVVVGLSYTEMGGEILPIEASKLVPGKGKLILTGKLGKVLSESAKIAFDWFKNASLKYGIYEDLGAVDVHIHLPAGAVSKEGPSAGIALATALVSVFSGIPPIPRIALTGEITLQGHVLPVGGLKEKLAAARKAGVTKVILPKKCESSLDDIPQHLLDQLEVTMVEHMSEVIDCAFDGAIAENSALVSKL